MSHLNYYDATTDSTPLPQYVEAREAKRKAFTAFWRGSIFGALLATGAFIGSAAWGQGFYRCEPPDRLTASPSRMTGQGAQSSHSTTR